jgi:hypothetical protein
MSDEPKMRTEHKRYAENWYLTVPALRDYIQRLGAEELNFRKFVVKEWKGTYWTDKVAIHVDASGKVDCEDKTKLPTDTEQAAITAAFATITLPTSMLADHLDGLFEEYKRRGIEYNEEDIYAFYERSVEDPKKPLPKIVMVQRRYINEKEGTKGYEPWTCFTDGKWRNMEPDGPLPFWKPPRARHKRIMVHEGGKAARFIDGLVHDPERVEELKAHPWGEYLADYDHWGLIGGALAPHRANYKELNDAKPSEVIYVCDNDFPGRSVLQRFSQRYKHAMKGIQFDSRWKTSWDMADPMPETFFHKGRYIGPKIETLLVGATYATDQSPNPAGVGRPITVITRDFKEEWVHSVQPEVFINIFWPNRIHTAPEFNNLVSPFSHVVDTATLLKKDQQSKGATLRYLPGQKPGIYSSTDGGGRFINTHQPPTIDPEPTVDNGPWIEFLETLFPVETDRHEVMRWVATLLARPDIKMHYGLLLVSEVQGVGKTTLGEKVLAPLVGLNNTSFPSENDIVDSQYNYWIAHKRLAVVNEIYAGHSSKAYDRLKSVITDRHLQVSKKYQAAYDIENWIHVVACSNSMRALKISVDDRRWFVPKVTEAKKPPQYWSDLNEWFEHEGGLGAIKYWAMEFLKTYPPVLQGQAAPGSAAKNEVIEEGYSQGQIMVSDLLEMIRDQNADKPWVVTDIGLVKYIRDNLYDGRHNDKLEKPMTIRKLAKAKSLYIGPTKLGGSKFQNSRLISNDPEAARLTVSDIEAGAAAGTLKLIDPKEFRQDF